jgi:hypothetical protein
MPPRNSHLERLVIALTPNQRAWVESEATRRSVSLAFVIRELVDQAVEAAHEEGGITSGRDR